MIFSTNFNAVILVFITYLFSAFAETLQCYKCTVLPPNPFSNETERLCSNFDHSDRYIIDCPYSTICMKKSYEVILNGAPIQGVQRDCASQKYKYQAYLEGKWQSQVKIEEPYTEGCQMSDDKGARISKTEYCYCRGYLCNAAPNLDYSNSSVDVICIIFVYNALKLFYSFR